MRHHHSSPFNCIVRNSGYDNWPEVKLDGCKQFSTDLICASLHIFERVATKIVLIEYSAQRADLETVKTILRCEVMCNSVLYTNHIIKKPPQKFCVIQKCFALFFKFLLKPFCSLWLT